VQGDTTTTFAAALAGFYQGAEIAHVEAGLRSFNKQAPFPEEINRRLTTHLTDLHFAPTEGARLNLLREGIQAGKILVTGNTIVDTLQQIVSRLESGNLDTPLRERFSQLPSKVILVTVHRRENHGKRLQEICSAVRELSDLFPGFHFFFPVHLHPQVQAPVNEILSRLPCVHLLPPLDYASFVWLMQQSCLIVSDSGGVQEECCALGKHVLVMREVTERNEAVESGFARLVGCDKGGIVAAAVEALTNGQIPDVNRPNPFGDGHAAKRIATALAFRRQPGA
jgi:UDP-N-acetylglucosamine 2-epimerase (non-hydrolysing)